MPLFSKTSLETTGFSAKRKITFGEQFINLYTAFQYAALSCLHRLCYSHFKFRITAKGVIDPLFQYACCFMSSLTIRKNLFLIDVEKHNKVTAGRL